MGVHKYTPNLAVNGESGWTPSLIRRKNEMLRLWNRYVNMDSDRLTKKIFLWDRSLFVDFGIKNCSYEINEIFTECGLPRFVHDVSNLQTVISITHCKNKLLVKYKAEWLNEVQNKPKLRTFKLFKSEFCTEYYMNLPMTRSQRSLLSQFRCAVLPLRIETGRFQQIDINDRICTFCDLNAIENEEHFLIECPLYTDYRNDLYAKCCNIRQDFRNMTNRQKLIFTMTEKNIIREVAKFIQKSYEKRQKELYK